MGRFLKTLGNSQFTTKMELFQKYIKNLDVFSAIFLVLLGVYSFLATKLWLLPYFYGKFSENSRILKKLKQKIPKTQAKSQKTQKYKISRN